MKKANPEEIRKLRAEGVSMAQIAEQFGITRARAYQLSGPVRTRPFREIPEEMCIYPNWRNWMNEHRVSPRSMVEVAGMEQCSNNYNSVIGWMNGRCYPTKKNIDRILAATGLTYEQLFAREFT